MSKPDPSFRHRYARKLRGPGGILALACLIAGLAPDARAQTTHGQAMPVTAQILLSCDIGGSASGNLPAGLADFGHTVYSPGQVLAVNATMPIRCNSLSATPYVSLDYGQNASGSQRKMIGPSGFLVPYELRMGSATAALWDNQFHPVTITSTGIQQVPVYAIVPSLPTGTPDGAFTDTIHVQLDY